MAQPNSRVLAVIHLVDQMLERFLRAAVPLPEGSVDVSFATPDRKWGASVTRPTVNLFLWDIKRSFVRATTGVAELADGTITRRPVPPVIDLRYFLTAWAADGRDEHQLLGSLLQAVITTPLFPQEFVPSQFADGAPISLGLAASSDNQSSEFWSSLDGQLKPGLDLRLGADLGTFAWTDTAEPAAVIDVGLARNRPAPDAADATSAPGGWRRDGKTVGGAVTATPPRIRARRNGRLIEEPGSTPGTPAGDPSG